MSASRVLLLRHGRTAYNFEERFQGQADIPLDDVGLGQAKRVADSLASHLSGDSVRILSSDLIRAFGTASAVAERLGVDVTPDPRLREVYAGVWQGLTRAEIQAGWPEDFQAWRRGDAAVRLGGGENRLEAADRAAQAVSEAYEALPPDCTLLCVSHGAALKGAVIRLLGLEGWPWNAFEGFQNAHWAELEWASRGWRLNRYNAN